MSAILSLSTFKIPSHNTRTFRWVSSKDPSVGAPARTTHSQLLSRVCACTLLLIARLVFRTKIADSTRAEPLIASHLPTDWSLCVAQRFSHLVLWSSSPDHRTNALHTTRPALSCSLYLLNPHTEPIILVSQDHRACISCGATATSTVQWIPIVLEQAATESNQYSE